MRLGLSMRQPNGRTLIQRAIASLRARGADAHLWLPGVGTLSGLTTGNYLESTGNTLATVDNPTGLVLDALGTVGSDVLNGAGSFDSSTGWLLGTGWSIAGGVATFAGGTDANLGYNSMPLTIGSTYLVELSVTIANGSLSVRVGSAAINDYKPTTSGTFSFYTVADAASGLTLRTESSTSGLSVSNISVKEVTGIHLTQATTANKPLLRRGLTNLLTYSSDFSNAAWVKDGGTLPTITVNAGAGPNGEITADRVVLNKTGVDYSRVYQRTGGIVGQAYTQAYWLKTYSGGSSNVGFRLDQTGINIVVTSDWTLFVLSTTNTSTGLDSQIMLWDAISGNDETADILIGGAALFQGTLTASQILAAGGIPTTTTAAASNPNAGKYSWSFDGSNDSLALGSVPFGLADDHVFIVGAQSGQVGTSIALCGLYSSVANNPRMQMYIGSANHLSMQYRSDGGTAVAPALSPALANFTPFVGSMRKIGTNATLRKDGSLSTTVSVATVDVVTANVAVVGETRGSYMNGPIGPVLAIKGTVSDAELLMYERLIAALTPGAPTF